MSQKDGSHIRSLHGHGLVHTAAELRVDLFELGLPSCGAWGQTLIIEFR